MAAGAQELILTNLKAALEGITVANGFRTEVATVEWAARDWCEAPQTATLPWIGIAPQEETFEARMGYIEGTWQIDLITHQQFSPHTMVKAVSVSSDLAMDIRRTLMSLECSQLGTANVHFVSVVRRHTNLASTEAYKQGVTTTVYRVVVRYEEALDAA